MLFADGIELLRRVEVVRIPYVRPNATQIGLGLKLLCMGVFLTGTLGANACGSSENGARRVLTLGCHALPGLRLWI